MYKLYIINKYTRKIITFARGDNFVELVLWGKACEKEDKNCTWICQRQ